MGMAKEEEWMENRGNGGNCRMFFFSTEMCLYQIERGEGIENGRGSSEGVGGE